jgi:hypothetical protein
VRFVPKNIYILNKFKEWTKTSEKNEIGSGCYGGKKGGKTHEGHAEADQKLFCDILDID